MRNWYNKCAINKFILKKFHFSISIVVFHLITKAVLADIQLTVSSYHVIMSGTRFRMNIQLPECQGTHFFFFFFLTKNRRGIWSWSDCNGIRTHCHLARKQTLPTLNHLTMQSLIYNVLKSNVFWATIQISYID